MYISGFQSFTVQSMTHFAERTFVYMAFLPYHVTGYSRLQDLPTLSLKYSVSFVSLFRAKHEMIISNIQCREMDLEALQIQL